MTNLSARSQTRFAQHLTSVCKIVTFFLSSQDSEDLHLFQLAHRAASHRGKSNATSSSTSRGGGEASPTSSSTRSFTCSSACSTYGIRGLYHWVCLCSPHNATVSGWLWRHGNWGGPRGTSRFNDWWNGKFLFLFGAWGKSDWNTWSSRIPPSPDLGWERRIASFTSIRSFNCHNVTVIVNSIIATSTRDKSQKEEKGIVWINESLTSDSFQVKVSNNIALKKKGVGDMLAKWQKINS